ncbi:MULTISPECIES: alpha/beta fold hydrolase [Sphingobium]|uniref:alpha/beta fold hydrolase n=1 Tax=Sphingobium TaxID=165695 RepID=UPI001835B0D1|nr:MULTISPECIES: alpha/beta fold hydrolase [Sphingobium]MCW2362120.1 polyhydroxyalkanoate synthase [Sphingobium sp. B10D3B]MCW2401201.1 polyhydroxyalkanoate synthase [Sphingobium sp. B10D7B]MCW2408181.1 polyhydroxyalkanoate synthase [Sphingobium xanthum]
MRGAGGDRAPVILIPSLINPPHVLDLSEQRSLLRYLGQQGHNALLLDWGTPDEGERDVDLADHVERLLLPLLQQLDRPPLLVGYCLGGTLAIGAAARLQALGKPIAGVATIAAPWDFSAYDAPFQSQLAEIWAKAKPGCEALGLVPMEVFQTGFWSLDPDRTIRKYAAFAGMEADSPVFHAFIALEDWANEGAPLTLASGRDLAERCYGANMTASGQWSIHGTVADPRALDCPTLAIASTTDRIVPAAAVPPAAERIDLALGHVGMMIGSRAKAQLWRGLSDWLSRCSG